MVIWMIVRIEFRKLKTGLIYATSPDHKGLSVSRWSEEALEVAVRKALSELAFADGRLPSEYEPVFGALTPGQ